MQLSNFFFFVFLSIILVATESRNVVERNEALSMQEKEELQQNISLKCYMKKLSDDIPARFPNDVKEYVAFVRASKCSMRCTLCEFGLITNENKINIEGLSKFSILFPPQNHEDATAEDKPTCTGQNIIDKCSYVEIEKDECEFAWLLWGCVSQICGVEE